MSRAYLCGVGGLARPLSRRLSFAPELTQVQLLGTELVVVATQLNSTLRPHYALANIAVPLSFDQSTSHWTFPLASGQFILTPFVRGGTLSSFVFSLVSFALHYHTPLSRLPAFSNDITARPYRPTRLHPRLSTALIHSAYIPIRHPENSTIQLSGLNFRYIACI